LVEQLRQKLICTFPDAEYGATLSTIAATFVTSLNVFILKIGTTFISQIPLSSIFLTLAGSILLVLSIISGRGSSILSGKKYLLKFLWIGIVGTSIPTAMITYGVSLSLVSNSFLLQVEAIYSMILSYILLKERIIKRQVLLTALSFLGVALILTDGVVRAINIGDILLLTAPLFFQLAHVVAKGLLKVANPIVVVTYRLLIGGLTLSIISIFFRWSLLEFLRTPQGTAVTLYLGVGYALSNSLWYYGVKHLNLSKATSIMIAYPLFSTTLSILMLKETLSYVKIIGITLVFFSTMMLTQVRSTSRREDNI
jgi:drug/metabolite transporter (DMT)-like permease